MTKNILLVDATWLAFKSFYATFSGIRMVNSQGIDTSAIHIFFTTVFRLIKLFEPFNIYFAFDKGDKTERHKTYPDYKKGRPKQPESLFEQMNIIKTILNTSNFAWSEESDFEADDLIASLQQKIRKEEPETEILIFTADQDLLQLIDNKTRIVSKIEKNFINFKTIDNFFEIYGFLPNQVIDFKVLAGDKSDNIKILEGLGEKGALKLLAKYKNLDGILVNIKNLAPKLGQQILEKREKLLFFKDFIKLNTNATFNFNIFEKQRIEINSHLIKILEELELKKVLLSLTLLAEGKLVDKEIES
ncbi:5'-3' exonuclease [Mycoplasma sp. 'Moose RK']|uniref:5'-3' exonuclease n=1 Tax=Mycoplasma sp. 'Moose RK' TaxID=2780095 RepID=UPI0018C31B87|nr:5'-3' exonuclease [Mycoplasma sp. 'Moose RK']MBG0731078.1 5'-3' exonuclease [Mycoplasma sp. 'Moose RK']